MSLVKYNNNSISAITDVISSFKGAMTHIKTLTADASTATLSFVNGSSDVVLDSTYPIYLFKVINAHAQNNGDILYYNFSDDTSSHSYDLTKTSTYFYLRHDEDGSDGQIVHPGSGSYTNIANNGNKQTFAVNNNSSNEDSCAGELWLFNPSNTTFAKHYMSRSITTGEAAKTFSAHAQGYINTTAAVTAVQFDLGSQWDAGSVKLYGIKDS